MDRPKPGCFGAASLLALLLFSMMGVACWGQEPSTTVEQLSAVLGQHEPGTPVVIDDKPVATKLSEGKLELSGVGSPPPTDPPAGERSVYGDFVLQPLYHSDGQRVPPFGSRLVDEQELRTNGVQGLTIRIIPKFLSQNGSWNYTFTDQCIQRCRNTNDRYTLLLASGGPTPLAEANLSFYEQAAMALGNRYRDDPLCVGAHINGASPTGHSEELFWGKPMPAIALAANKRMIDAWTVAFPEQVKILAGSANDPAAMKELIKYGKEKTGGKFLYKNNAMKAGTVLTWEGNTLVVWAGQNGVQVGWEMVGSTLEDRFGGSYAKMYSNVDFLVNKAGKKIDERYLAHYPPDISRIARVTRNITWYIPSDVRPALYPIERHIRFDRPTRRPSTLHRMILR